MNRKINYGFDVTIPQLQNIRFNLLIIDAVGDLGDNLTFAVSFSVIQSVVSLLNKVLDSETFVSLSHTESHRDFNRIAFVINFTRADFI